MYMIFFFIYHIANILQLLKNKGVFSIQNFWYILKPTWIYQITTKYHCKEQNKYIKHIQSGNNNNFQDISIVETDQQSIFFTTITLVFDINIIINNINNTSHTPKTINPRKSDTTKIINCRHTVIGGDIFEPWIKESDIQQSQKVLQMSSTACYSNASA